MFENFSEVFETALKGGKGSGNWGHGGLPGVHGGSSSGGLGAGANLSGDGVVNRIKKYANNHSDSARGETPRDEAGFGAWVDKDMKHHIVQTLSEQTGVGYEDVNDAIKSWAETSNKSYDSYLTQKAATEIFGVKLSGWQAEDSPIMFHKFQDSLDAAGDEITTDLLKELSKKFPNGFPDDDSFPDDIMEDFLDEFVMDSDKYFTGDLRRSEVTNLSYHGYDINLQITGEIRTYSGYTESFISDWDMPVGWLDEEFGDVVKDLIKTGNYTKKIRFDGNIKRYNDRKKIMSAIYQNTQSLMGNLFPGKKTITLYRGVADFDPKSHRYEFNALESWSASLGIASLFSRGDAVVKTTVPIDRIFSTCLTGMGCLREMEFIVLGGNYDVEFV